MSMICITWWTVLTILAVDLDHRQYKSIGRYRQLKPIDLDDNSRKQTDNFVYCIWAELSQQMQLVI